MGSDFMLIYAMSWLAIVSVIHLAWMWRVWGETELPNDVCVCLINQAKVDIFPPTFFPSSTFMLIYINN